MWVITEAMDAEWGKSLRKEDMGEPPVHCPEGRQRAPSRFLSPDVPQGPFGDLKGSMQLGWDSLSVSKSLPSRHGALASQPAEAWAWQYTHLSI